jgi:hypothetical protein
MPLRKLCSIVDQYGWNSAHPDKFWSKYSTSNFDNICKTVYAIHGNVNLRFYVSQPLLQINTAEYRARLTAFIESLPYGISTKFAKRI